MASNMNCWPEVSLLYSKFIKLVPAHQWQDLATRSAPTWHLRRFRPCKYVASEVHHVPKPHGHSYGLANQPSPAFRSLPKSSYCVVKFGVEAVFRRRPPPPLRFVKSALSLPKAPVPPPFLTCTPKYGKRVELPTSEQAILTPARSLSSTFAA